MDPDHTLRTSAAGRAAAHALRHHQRITPPPWTYYQPSARIESADRRPIAYVPESHIDENDLPQHTAVDHANGRVLAAAPELLDAVRALLAVLPDRAGDASEAARRDGLAAVARAEGRAP